MDAAYRGNYVAFIDENHAVRPASGPGRIGRYEVVGMLGTGAFAAVYRAVDPALDAEVAIKVLADHHSAVPDIRERFINEARVLRRLASDRIVAVHDIGEHNGQPYVVLEVIEGGTLEARLATVAPNTADLSRLVSELGACLDAVHAGGVVHRDIKPSNLLIRSAPGAEHAATELIGPDEQLVLADFGLARVLGLTSLTIAAGTDGYMAPEQRLAGTTIDERADVFAATAVVAAAVHGSISDVRRDEMAAGSGPLDRALAIGLAEAPGDRYASAAEWSAAIGEALAAESADPSRPAAGRIAAVSSSSSSPSPPASTSAATRRRSWRSGAAVAAVAAAMVVGVVAVWITRPSSEGDGRGSPPGDVVDAAGAAGAAGSPAASLSGAWSTDGASIVDAGGTNIVVRAIDWGGFDSDGAAPFGLAARSWRDVIDQIAELGFNTINLPFASDVLDEGTMPSAIDASLNADLAGKTSLQVMDAVIGYAATKGLAVTLERRLLTPDSEVPALWYDNAHSQQRFVSDWEFLAQRYASLPNVVGAALAGAPHGVACWACGDEAVDWKAAAELGGNAVHRFAPGWLVLVAGVETVNGGACADATGAGCAWWGSNLSGAVDDPVTLEQPNKVVYAPVDYATSTFDQPWFGAADFPANLPAVWDGFWGELVRSGTAPVLVGFGSTLASDVDVVWIETLLAYLDDLGASFAYRSLSPSASGVGGLLLDDWITVDDAKSALLQPHLDGPFG